MSAYDFKNPEAVADFHKQATLSYSPLRLELSRRMAVDMAMYSGSQWVYQGRFPGDHTSNNYLNFAPANWSPNTRDLRVTVNRIARLVQKAAAATFPDEFEVDVSPPERGGDVSGSVLTDLTTDVVNVALDRCGLLSAWTNANFLRSVSGAWCIGMHIRQSDVEVDPGTGQPMVMADRSIEAFDFPAVHLTVDPAAMKLELNRHEYVGYSDVWSGDKIARVFGIKIPEDQLTPIGNLVPVFMDINRLTQGRLFGHYVAHSKTLGARVHQWHVREGNRFSKMYVGLELKGVPFRVMNFDNPVSPFGGTGLPFMLLTGHRRADGYGWIGDVAMLKDDQDRINMINTLMFRMLVKNAGWQFLVDKRTIPGGKTPEAYAAEYNNAVAGFIPYEGRSREQNAEPPRMIQYPTPPPFLQELVNTYEGAMREGVHRAEANFGELQTHIPDSSFRRALEEAGEVLGQRVREDLRKGNEFVRTLLGTTVKMVQEGRPAPINALMEDGFEQGDIEHILTMDPYNPPCRVHIRESSIRYRSLQAKRADLDGAMQRQALSPFEYRMGYAKLDVPIIGDDRYYLTEAKKAAYRVLMGEEWSPVPLGVYSAIFMAEFRKALLDPRARTDRSTQQRISNAIIMQLQADAAEQAMRAQIMGQGQPQQGQPGAQPSGEENLPLDQLVAAMEARQSGNVPQPQ